jgi:hypothetical protein
MQKFNQIVFIIYKFMKVVIGHKILNLEELFHTAHSSLSSVQVEVDS